MQFKIIHHSRQSCRILCKQSGIKLMSSNLIKAFDVKAFHSFFFFYQQLNNLQSPVVQFCSRAHSLLCSTTSQDCIPLMPTEGAPAATAARAYSIWTSFPEGLQEETHGTPLLCCKAGGNHFKNMQIKQLLGCENRNRK